MSKRETILARIMTVLAGTVNVGSRIYRSRVEPLARGEAPAIVVEPVSDQAAQVTVATLHWQLTVSVAIIVRGAVPDQLADPILADAHARLMSDPTLDGLVVEIVPQSVRFELLAADQPAGVIVAEYRCAYRTNLTTLS